MACFDFVNPDDFFALQKDSTVSACAAWEPYFEEDEFARRRRELPGFEDRVVAGAQRCCLTEDGLATWYDEETEGDLIEGADEPDDKVEGAEEPQQKKSKKKRKKKKKGKKSLLSQPGTVAGLALGSAGAVLLVSGFALKLSRAAKAKQYYHRDLAIVAEATEETPLTALH